jgi:hypothetical protein
MTERLFKLAFPHKSRVTVWRHSKGHLFRRVKFCEKCGNAERCHRCKAVSFLFYGKIIRLINRPLNLNWPLTRAEYRRIWYWKNIEQNRIKQRLYARMRHRRLGGGDVFEGRKKAIKTFQLKRAPLLEIATKLYLSGLDSVQVGEKMGISRWAAARLIRKARIGRNHSQTQNVHNAARRAELSELIPKMYLIDGMKVNEIAKELHCSSRWVSKIVGSGVVHTLHRKNYWPDGRSFLKSIQSIQTLTKELYANTNQSS